MNISASKAISLLPFGYFAVTRISSLRDLAYLVASSWLPAVWLLMRLGELETMPSATTFALGYMAFIAAYEIGYLVNDAWDARRTDDGRARLSFRLSWPYLVAFAAIRIALWVSIAVMTGWIENTVWVAGYATLAIALAQHNLVSTKGLRLASFFELATLRFVLPILAAIPTGSLGPVLFVALILYAFPRFLAYMESKDLLNLEQRRELNFGFLLLLSLLPLMVLLSYLVAAPVIVELSIYFLAVYGAWWALSLIAQPNTG